VLCKHAVHGGGSSVQFSSVQFSSVQFLPPPCTARLHNRVSPILRFNFLILYMTYYNYTS